MTDRAAILAQVVDIQNDRQHKGFIKVTLHVVDIAGPHLNNVLGAWPTYTDPVPVALARINVEAREVAPKPPPDSRDKVPEAGARDTRLTARAGILCKDVLFHRYLEWFLDRETVDEEFATIYLRQWCNVESRAQIISGTDAAQLFGDLLDQFYGWREAPNFAEQLPT